MFLPASSHGQLFDREGLSCSISAGTAASWIKSTLDGRRVSENFSLRYSTFAANNKASLIFPGGVHNEPHRHVSWAEFQYVIDDYGGLVVHTKFGKVVDWPSNGLQIVGCLRPAFIDEESYLRRLFHRDDGDNYISDWRAYNMCNIVVKSADESEKEEEQVAGAYDLIGMKFPNEFFNLSSHPYN
ncbi:hypothetical protein BHE74_00019987 [Ensete ventricosum]|nr:hypothetical protein GW17_00036463 [Ensete ventricosum]RWW72221.1 hypothetical protein BHE74_00019987 [Ensete ventricosum]